MTAEQLKKGKALLDKIAQRARTEKQRVLLTETNGDANIDWDTRSLQDAKLLMEYGLNYIKKKIEKQGEQKPAIKIELDDNGEPVLTPFEAELFSMMSEAWQCYSFGEEVNIAKIVKEHSIELLERANEQKPAWSEEDEYHKRQILRILKDNGCSQTLQKKTEKWIEERLKSLRPQSQFKPSDDQIMALIWVLNHMFYASRHKEEISGLLEQLKKLREE